MALLRVWEVQHEDSFVLDPGLDSFFSPVYTMYLLFALHSG